MKTVSRLALAGCVLVALSWGVLPVATVAQGTGVYAAAQAKRGAAIYGQQCEMCHGAALDGLSGPPLAGSAFMKKWAGQTAAELHEILAVEMPLTAPGSLKPAEYLALLAYILQKNGYPAGTTPLEAAGLKKIPIKTP